MQDEYSELANRLSVFADRQRENERELSRITGITDTLATAFVPRDEILAMHRKMQNWMGIRLGSMRMLVLFNSGMLVVIFCMLCLRFSANAPHEQTPRPENPALATAPKNR